MATPTVEDLLQQLIQGQQRTMERIDAIVVQSTNTNTRIDIELAQSMAQDQSLPHQPTAKPMIKNHPSPTQATRKTWPQF